MIKNSIIKKHFAILALSMSAVMFTHTACAKDPAVKEPTIIMTTKASEVNFEIKIKAGADKSGNLTIDWGDGKKGNVTDAISNDDGSFQFSREYSGKSEYRITITGDNIVSLSCGHNQLTALDVSRNTALTTLSCSDNQLTALNVSGNAALIGLSCSYNQLAALDVSKNTALTSLSCNSNQLAALDVSRNTSLIFLNCRANQLTALDVSMNTAIESLEACRNQITKLDVSPNSALRVICCKDNQLTTSALNDLFGSLPYIPKGTWASINFGGTPPNHNPGALDCERSIAEGKGWVFDQLHGSNAYSD